MASENHELKVSIMKDADKNFSVSHIPVQKFNENYHKYVGNSHNVYFIIPVSNISNLFLIYDRKSMPQIFRPTHIEYRLEILRIHDLAGAYLGKSNGEIESILYNKNLSVDIETPHDLFTFIYNLNELVLFNTLFNDTPSYTVNDCGWSPDMYVFLISWYKIKDSSIEEKEISGIPDLISILENKYKMGLNVSYPFKLRFNSDGSCAYSDPNELFNSTPAKVIGNVECKGNYVTNLFLPHMEIPVHTFVSSDDYHTINCIDYYDQFRGGSVTFFMGEPFDTNIINAPHGNIFISNDNFSMRKCSTFNFKCLQDLIIYLKLAPGMIRTTQTLISMTLYDAFDEYVIPGFNYEISLFDSHWINRPIDKPMNYSRNYIIDSDNNSEIHGVVNDCNVAINGKTTNVEDLDMYDDFMKDIEDFYIPF